ncbi:MAG: alternative ribosome rescue aminoacyl-tRNA hydrolase ArfB [Chitinophagales bacterium]|nr:alternative ribosome rescue aminoacyl-tRNA hydrolase ArfB [Chitinophagales bacterium]
MNTLKDFADEVSFKTSRSAGAGGQHVNKVSSKVELTFNVPRSKLLDEGAKELIANRIPNKLDAEGNIKIISQLSRSQYRNKEDALRKLSELIEKALQPIKVRKASKPSKAMVRKRLEKKKVLSEKKQARVKIKLHHL